MTTSITPQSAANPEDLAALADELEISLPPTELWSDEPPLESLTFTAVKSTC